MHKKLLLLVDGYGLGTPLTYILFKTKVVCIYLFKNERQYSHLEILKQLSKVNSNVKMFDSSLSKITYLQMNT